MEKSTFGCIVFDSPTRQNCGWYAVGEEPAKRFESPKSLERAHPDCLWLSNISYEVNKACGTPKQLSCCLADYLHEDITRLAERYRIIEAPGIAELGAKLLCRTLALARFLLNDPDFTPGRSLRHGLRKKADVKDVVLPPEQGMAMQEATFYNMTCSVPGTSFPGRKEAGYFTVFQQKHCVDLLESFLPEGKMIEYKRDCLPSKEGDRDAVARFLKDHKSRPGLFHVTWHSLDDNVCDILHFVKDDEYLQHNLWLTNPDLELLQPWADILIHQAYFAESCKRFTAAKIFDRRLPLQSLLSLSCERFFSNYWHGLATKQSPPRLRADLIPLNPYSAYLHARDRQLLFQTVVDLKAAGLQVLSYANGRIRVDLRNTNPEDIYRIARQTDCLPPFLGLNPSTLEKPDPDDPLACMQFAHATNAISNLLAIDGKIMAQIGENTKKESV